MTDNEIELQQLALGLFRTRDITLATTLMTSDYPGVILHKVEADAEWRRGDKPKCTFILSVEDPGVLEQAIDAYRQNRPQGLPVTNTGDYDTCKKHLVDAMRTARAQVV